MYFSLFSLFLFYILILSPSLVFSIFTHTISISPFNLGDFMMCKLQKTPIIYLIRDVVSIGGLWARDPLPVNGQQLAHHVVGAVPCNVGVDY